MTYKITKNINRISFHDSRITDFKLTDNVIVLQLDWAKLDNYEEENLPSLVLGSCVLTLNGVYHSSLEVEKNKGNIKLDFSDTFPKQFKEILENVSQNDNEISFKGFTPINGTNENNVSYQWTIWKLCFESFEFTWSTSITVDEWENGSIPN